MIQKMLTLAIVLAALASSATSVAPHRSYQMEAVVVSLDYDTDVFTVLDYTGNLWDFDEIEDLEILDRVTLTMDDNGTPDDITDDICTEQFWHI